MTVPPIVLAYIGNSYGYDVIILHHTGRGMCTKLHSFLIGQYLFDLIHISLQNS